MITSYSRTELRNIAAGMSPRGRVVWSFDESVERAIREYDSSGISDDINMDDIVLMLESLGVELTESQLRREQLSKHMRRAVDKGLLVNVVKAQLWRLPS